MIRLFARCVRAAAALWLLQACTAAAATHAPVPARPPATGVVLLSLRTGAVVGQRALGDDPLAVVTSADGRTAYIADNDLGDVFALHLPSLKTAWRTHVGGRPSGLLLHGSSLYVSQYDTAQVADLDALGGGLLQERPVPPHPGQMIWSGSVTTSGDHGFGIAAAGGQTWTAGRLPRLGGIPFWLAAGGPGELLVTSEGTPEDTAPGSVVSIETSTGRWQTLATPRDPDQVERFGGDIFVAAHGDRDVLAIRSGRTQEWIRGAEAVALAPDPGLGLLVVVTDANE